MKYQPMRRAAPNVPVQGVTQIDDDVQRALHHTGVLSDEQEVKADALIAQACFEIRARLARQSGGRWDYADEVPSFLLGRGHA